MISTARASARELIAAVAIMIYLLSLHVIMATAAGGLWRDEAETVSLATSPTLPELWSNLEFNSFPLLWPMMLRGFDMLVGTAYDPALRTLGLCVGIGLVAALWLNARTFGHGIPFFSLLLFAGNPSVIRWGDSMRAYGWGLTMILIACATMWKYVENPTRIRFAIASLAAIVSVQSLFHNPVLILAFCSGGVTVFLRHHDWKKAGGVVLIGFLAALSLLPYLPTIRAAGRWNFIMQTAPYGPLNYIIKITEALLPAGPFIPVLWIFLLFAAVLMCIAARSKHIRPALTEHQRDVTLFATVSLIVGFIFTFIFLRKLHFPTAPWYYLTIMALAAVMIDAIFGALIINSRAKVIVAGAVIVVFALSYPFVLNSVAQRMTNMDLVADRLEHSATANDFIVVNYWFYGLSFARYYKGPAPWMTVPALGVPHLHRFDIFLQMMQAKDQTAPVEPVLSGITETLKAGHRVFLVGYFPRLPRGYGPRMLSSAPDSRWGWQQGAYAFQWVEIVNAYLADHASRRSPVNVAVDRPISIYENMTLEVCEGWNQS